MQGAGGGWSWRAGAVGGTGSVRVLLLQACCVVCVGGATPLETAATQTQSRRLVKVGVAGLACKFLWLLAGRGEGVEGASCSALPCSDTSLESKPKRRKVAVPRRTRRDFSKPVDKEKLVTGKVRERAVGREGVSKGLQWSSLPSRPQPG